MSGGHAPLAPSAAPRWVPCPASRALEAQFPNDDSIEAQEGEAAHWVAMMFASGQAETITEGTRAPNGVVVTGEMLDGAELWASHLAGRVRHLERPLSCARIHGDNWGTPDHRGLIGNVLYIDDYKYGHRFVDAYRNWQLLDYLAGAMDAEDIDGLREQHMEAELSIVQPRNFERPGPIRVWRFPLVEARALFNELRQSAAEAMGPNPTAKPGPQCYKCKGRHVCPAGQRSVYSVAEVMREVTPVELTPEAVAYELSWLTEAREILDARIDGLEQHAAALIRSGLLVPGYTLEQGKGRTCWSKPLAEVLALGSLYDLDLSKPGAITPKQAADRGLPPDLIAAYSETPSGETKLKPDGDKARRVFGRSITL